MSLVVLIGLSVSAGVLVHRHALIAAFGLAGVLVVGIGWPLIAARAVKLTVTPTPGRSSAGEEVGLDVSARNTWPLPFACIELQFEQISGTTQVAFVRPWQRSAVAVRVTPTRRGVVPAGVFSGVTSFPFGLLGTRINVSLPSEWVVWPAVQGGVKTPYPVAPDQQANSAYGRPRTVTQSEFSGVRPYQRGDSVRRIHWPATARHDRLIAREQQAAPMPAAWLLLDFAAAAALKGADRTPYFCERCIVQAAGAVTSWSAQGVAIGLIVPGQIYQPCGVAGQRVRLLDALARVDASRSITGQQSTALRGAHYLVSDDGVCHHSASIGKAARGVLR